jgi:hypothetical protein
MTEAEAEFVLKDIIASEQQRLQTILAPYFAELTHLSYRKPPSPIHTPDGRLMLYTGPTATDLGGPYHAPAWLEEMCNNPGAEYDALRWFRRHSKE